MNENIKAGGDIHAGDGGYSIGTKEKYDEFVKNRNRMNERIQQLADKIWEEKYWTHPNTDKLLPAQLNRFAELIVRECIGIVDSHRAKMDSGPMYIIHDFKKHFGVEE